MPDRPGAAHGGLTAKPPRLRLDQLLVERGLVESRARAQAVLMAGLVFSGERRLDKPGQAVATDIALELRGQPHPWVSRGGVKLAHGLARFGFSPAGLVCLDVGASTGGFTDVLLHGGAARVHAVDVGHGQLDWKLRQDPRVVVREKLNARRMTAEDVAGEPIAALVCDASFIGLRTLLPAPLALCAPGAWAIALIKPQFEMGPKLAPGGVVRDPAVHEQACEMIGDWWSTLPGWTVEGIEPSPITGPEGNREFLLGARLACGHPCG